MAEHIDRDDLPRARSSQRRDEDSVVWIIPILAAVVAIGIAIQRVMSPTITIILKDAQGLEAGKTFVKYKDVNIGQVTSVKLSPDHSKVEVTAKIDKSAGGLMVEDAKFWVVEPRVTLSGVSGLSTLLSGNYIGFEVGQSKKQQRNFTGLEVAPIITGGQPGRSSCWGGKPGSLGIGSPHYRTTGGQVTTAWRPMESGSRLRFCQRALRQVRQSRHTFWNASGVDHPSARAGGGAHAISNRADRGRPRVRYPVIRRNTRAPHCKRDPHSLHGPGHRAEAGGVDIGALRALLK
jgi:paraquat-inducible protein B